MLPAVDDPELASLLAQAYTEVTGWKRVTPGQRRLLLVCYRRHGPRTVPLLRQLYAEMGTTADLLGRLKTHPVGESAAPPARADQAPRANPVSVGNEPADDITAALDGASWVNAPCSTHRSSEWAYRSHDGSPYCARCDPTSAVVGLAPDPTGEHRRVLA